MKWQIFLLLVAGLSACNNEPEITGGVPVLTLNDTILDIGTIRQRSKPDIRLSVQNTGTGLLKIEDVEGNCECLQTEWSKDPVRPGSTSDIRIHYNTMLTGGFEKRLIIKTNEPKAHTVFIRGRVE